MANEIRELGLRQLEWDKTAGDTAFGSANAAVERHNREIVSAYKLGVEAMRSAMASTFRPQKEEEEELYLIQDTRSYCGNAVFWWCVDGNGYTTNINKAWRVSKEKAEAKVRIRSTDRAWRASTIEAKAFPIFDMQDFPREQSDGE